MAAVQNHDDDEPAEQRLRQSCGSNDQIYAVYHAYHDGCIRNQYACRSGAVLDDFQPVRYFAAGNFV